VSGIAAALLLIVGLKAAFAPGDPPRSPHADTKTDGKLEREESRDMPVSLRKTAQAASAEVSGGGQNRFNAMDKNGDGKISRDEFTGREAVFNWLDANSDGFITREETRVLRGYPGMILLTLKDLWRLPSRYPCGCSGKTPSSRATAIGVSSRPVWKRLPDSLLDPQTF
jgi:EF hand